MKVLDILHIPVKHILKQAAARSLIPTPFQYKVYSPLQPACAYGWFPLLIIPDPALEHIKGNCSLNWQSSLGFQFSHSLLSLNIHPFFKYLNRNFLFDF